MLKFVITVTFLVWILWLFYTSFDEAFGAVAYLMWRVWV